MQAKSVASGNAPDGYISLERNPTEWLGQRPKRFNRPVDLLIVDVCVKHQPERVGSGGQTPQAFLRQVIHHLGGWLGGLDHHHIRLDSCRIDGKSWQLGKSLADLLRPSMVVGEAIDILG